MTLLLPGQGARPHGVPWTTALLVAGATLVTAATLSEVPAAARAASLLLADFAPLRRGQLWRLLTGPLAHATAGHLWRDGAYCAVLGALYEPALGRRWRQALLLGLVGPTLAMFLLRPELRGYLGLSGTAHALSALALVHELRSRRGAAQWLVAVLATVMAAKLLHEARTGTLLYALSLGSHAVPAPTAHLWGGLLGAAVALAGQGGAPPPLPGERAGSAARGFARFLS